MANRGKPRWPDDEESALRAYRLSGISTSEIAKELTARFARRISRGAVAGKLHRLGLTDKTYSARYYIGRSSGDGTSLVSRADMVLRRFG